MLHALRSKLFKSYNDCWNKALPLVLQLLNVWNIILCFQCPVTSPTLHFKLCSSYYSVLSRVPNDVDVFRINDPPPIFKTFPRQQMAFDYLKTCQEVGELQFKISNYFILISGSKHQVFFSSRQDYLLFLKASFQLHCNLL